MEWFRIEWKGSYPIESAPSKKEAQGVGVYAIFEMKNRVAKLLYLGETYRQTFAKRLNQHKKEWLFRIDGKLAVCFGTLFPPEGRRISSQRILDVEAAMIHSLRPPYNQLSKRGYRGRNILIINTGKTLCLDPVVSDDPNLLPLLKKALR
jgi:hypothetical protein